MLTKAYQSIFMSEVILTKAYQPINQSIFMPDFILTKGYKSINQSLCLKLYWQKHINQSINLYAWSYTDKSKSINQSINLYAWSYTDKGISINQSIFIMSEVILTKAYQSINQYGKIYWLIVMPVSSGIPILFDQHNIVSVVPKIKKSLY